MNVGVIGAGGYWGRRILRAAVGRRNISVRRCSVFSNIDRLRRVCEETCLGAPQPVLTASHEPVLGDPDIQAVVISTPATAHYALARQALEAGKHVFVEKPLCLTGAEAAGLTRLAAAAGRVLFVDHTYMHSTCVAHLKELLDSGSLGRPLFIDFTRRQLGIYRQHSVLWDLAPHDLSIIGFLFPDEAVARMRVTSWAHFGHVDASRRAFIDAARYAIEFQSGLKASGFLSWCHPKRARDVVVAGTEGMLLFEDNTVVRLFRRDAVRDELPSEDGWRQVEQFCPDDDPLASALTDFCELVETGQTPPRHMSPQFAVQIVEMIERMEKASTRPDSIPGKPRTDET